MAGASLAPSGVRLKTSTTSGSKCVGPAHHGSAHALDGGAARPTAPHEARPERHVLLARHAFPQSAPGEWVPGRLYFDHQPLPLRSESEAGILSLLGSAEVRYGEPIQLSPNALILGDAIRQVLARGPEENPPA